MNVILKPVNMLLAFVYTPQLVSYLGIEKYGLWTTILTIISWINYFDIGLGQGLRNILARELEVRDYLEARSSISTAYMVLSLVSVIILSFSILLIAYADTNELFNTKYDIRLSLYISICFICLNFILALCNMILYAMQLSEKVAIRSCLAQSLNILGIQILSYFSSENLIYISVLFGLSTTLTYIYTTFQIAKKHIFFVISHKYFNINKIKQISNIGIKFFLIQIPLIVMMSMDNVIVTNLFGAAITTSYSIVNNVFGAMYSILCAYIVPYWSKTTAAIANNNIEWVKKVAIRLNIIAFVFSFVLVAVAFFFRQLAFLWLKTELEYPPYLIPIMCLFYCLLSIIAVNVQIINGTGKVNIQVILNLLMGLAYIPLAVFFAKSCNYGVIGIKMVGVLYNIISVFVYPINLYFILKDYEKG